MDDMQYRPIGKTGLSASIIGLGTEHLDNKPYPLVEEVIHAALEQGINMMDVFMPGEAVRGNIGKALAGNREKVMIQGHLCSVDLREQYDVSRDLEVCKRYFDKLLTCLNTDYIDFGMLFILDSHEAIDAVFDNGIVRYAQDLKRQGVIRALGASSHNPHTASRIVESGVIDLLMFSINPAFDLMAGASDIKAMLTKDLAELMHSFDPARAELYRLCESRGVGITVMKTLGAGKLLSAEHTPFGRAMTPAQCIHYALNRPAVVSTLIGCQSRQQVLDAVSYLNLSDEEKDYAPAISSVKRDFRGSCVYCNHCLPCPSGIDIATVNKYLDIAALDEAKVPPSVRQHYAALAAHGSDCIECGSCEGRCPFGVPVAANMRRAAA
ncbi:aldo/keto reductase, partial [Desulfovibrio sp. OttesenSCG-928-C14]|nr:aldo/keto reductase [Desulfovibrio sp. OttesenSCG-928-C14]